ncbi:alpha/beta fold hydrolase [Actinokineospora enzanensis]|uniref:alpha/beta fold hydrolase n=1 Tax=Actinokineospora enzanensis TaxID=155975 RepID=UPI00038271E0|nr:alpha/beta hydrolase [Actinokineospora enzanensis]
MHSTDTPLVLFHAFPLDSRMWDGVRAGLSEHVRLITPDQRGFGRSPLGDAEPSLETVAADAVGLLDALGIERAVIGGCSMGGYVSMAMLRAAPERVAGVLFVDTKLAADDPGPRANRLAVAERAERDGVAGWLAESMLPALVGDHPVRATVRDWIEEQSGAAVAWAQRAMAARPDSRETVRALDLDMLVVHGTDDALIPVDLAHDLGSVARAEVIALPGLGHLPSVQDPDAFLAAVVPWLRSRT